MNNGLLMRDGSFAGDLTRLRTQQGMSVEALADRSGYTPGPVRIFV